MTDWDKIIDAAHSATEMHGVQVQRGKKYSQVVTRVELFRRHLPEWGIDTSIVALGQAPGETVVVRAVILDNEGRTRGAGHASEIVGQGNVNRTSALENAETSAIGRALASLGIAGGEYASLNEIDGVKRKEEAQAQSDAKLITDAQVSLSSATTAEELHETWKIVYRKFDGRVPDTVERVKDERKVELLQEQQA